jgi:RNA polymerase primary sigma factor
VNENDTGLNRYLREIGRFPLLTPQQEIELAAKIKKGDAKAREQMINSNLRLVVTIAHDYANLGLPLLDLISEGNIGLTKAVERFEPGKGAKLSTYAMWWIRQSIKRALANQSKTIRLPVHLVDKVAKVRRVSLQMSDELGREPTDDELGEEIGIAAKKVARLRSVGIRPASLDAPIGEDDSTEFSEVIGDEDAQTPFELLRDENLRNEMGGLLEVLDNREKKIITKRFGLDGGKPKTLESVSKDFGVTRERIRQLQNIALAKLRRAFSKREAPVGRSAGSRQTDLYVSRRGYYDAIDLGVGPDVLLAEPPQKWQAHFTRSQHNKIPRVPRGRHRIPAER